MQSILLALFTMISPIIVPYKTMHLSHTPSSFVTWGILILDTAIAPYSIYRFQYLFPLFYSTCEPADGDKTGGVATTSNVLQHQKGQLTLFLSHFLDKGVIQKRTDVYPTVPSTGIFLLFPSFFAKARMLITFYRPTYQGAGCLHTAPMLLRRRPLRPPRTAIKTLTIHDGRGRGLEQAIREVERDGLDL